MLAILQSGSAEKLALTLHVVGAIALFGGTLALASLAWAGVRRPDVPLLARTTFRTLLVVALPAWVLMRIGAALIESKEKSSGAITDEEGWLGVGFMVAEPGLLLLLLATGAAFWWTRREGRAWQGRAVAILLSIYVVVLAAAWWAMSAKPGS